MKFPIFIKKLSVSLVLISVFSASGCINPAVQIVTNPEAPRERSKKSTSENRIEIFFDGTKNKWDSRTNVRRRFEMIAAMEDPHVECYYVDGVGNQSWFAAALGIGMKARVLEGYKFLASNWHKDTKIRIFGFSRGSLQARMLAGMMAHSGLPLKGNMDKKKIDEIAEEIWKFSRDSLKDPEIDSSSPNAASKWESALAANRNATQEHIHKMFGDDITFANPDIEFMGIWDTVPGLTLAELKKTGELKNVRGTKYKVRPYPNTRVIAHALALDERRNTFAPLLVGGPLDPSRTVVHEVWFPGAHSDVGGGYSDSNDMAGTTFNWVHKILHDHGFSRLETEAYSDSRSILHHPESNRFYDFAGGKQRRVIPEHSIIDRTVFIRANGDGSFEQGPSGTYPKILYRPVLTVELGSKGTKTISITSTKNPASLLSPYLILNNSELNASSQKTTVKVVDPANLQLAVKPSSEPAAPEIIAAPKPTPNP